MAQTIAGRWIARLERLEHEAYCDACDKMQEEIVRSRFDGEFSVNTFKDGSRMQCLPNLGRIEIKPVKPPKVKAKAAGADK
jgi:hypothetical protein